MKLVYNVKDKPKFGQLIVFAFQQLLAILAATIAVPSVVNGVTGSEMSQSAALFGAGVGTIVYLLFTKFKSPVFLGSSFAFLGSMFAAFGGAGTGKTTALRVLEEKGALALDCDAVYHELLQTDEAMLSELRERFPAAFSGDTLDRKALGSIVFHDSAALEELNAITHRHVRAELRRRLTDWAWQGGTLAAVDAIALIESGIAADCACTVAVTAERETRKTRIMAREGITEEYALSRIDAQKDDSFFQENCTYTLENNGTQKEFEMKCREFFGDL